jgi:hypothetical protein
MADEQATLPAGQPPSADLSRGEAPALPCTFGRYRLEAALTHPNICPVYDLGEIDGVPYLTDAPAGAEHRR